MKFEQIIFSSDKGIFKYFIEGEYSIKFVNGINRVAIVLSDSIDILLNLDTVQLNNIFLECLNFEVFENVITADILSIQAI